MECRLIRSKGQPGAENMALDEVLLNELVAEPGTPVIRFYRWQPPCLSLGFSQPIADADQAALVARNWHLVRRPTGGRAILHTDELTYSVVLPLSSPLARGGVMASYQRLSRGLLLGLRNLGLKVEIEREEAAEAIDRANPVCFEVPSAYELTVQGRKLIGSAQVRRQRAMLQHGSLPLSGDLGRICDVLSFESDRARQQAKDRLHQRAGTVESLSGQSVSWEQASQALAAGFAEAFNLQFIGSKPTDQEIRKATALTEQRYSNPEWTERL